MRNIWVISDTHFNHENILKFIDGTTGRQIRPKFDSVEQMDEFMIENWNTSIKNGDLVYHLGDVFIGDREKFKKIWPKLNGSKRLVVGNHDDIKFLCAGGFFKKVYESRIFRHERLIFTHRPAHETQMEVGAAPGLGTKLFNVHGHIHQNPSPPGAYFNVSVENTNYKPVHIDELIQKAKEWFEHEGEKS